MVTQRSDINFNQKQALNPTIVAKKEFERQSYIQNNKLKKIFNVLHLL
jgi:hypothetical protein